MAITPGSRQRETTGTDRNPLNAMQEPIGSMDNPGSRTSNVNEVDLPPGETVHRTGNLGSSRPGGTERNRSLTTTLIIAAVVLLAGFLIAMYLGNNRSDMATGTGSTQPPVADSNNGTGSDATGSTTPPAQPAPGSGDTTNNTTGGSTGTTTPPANP